MNKTIKRRWIKALTSGKYKQGKGALKRGDRFCCLGVLCDLHSRTKAGAKWRDDFYLHTANVLPNAVSQWAGLGGDPFGSLPLGARVETLMAANDNGKRFSTIAKLIEQYL